MKKRNLSFISKHPIFILITLFYFCNLLTSCNTHIPAVLYHSPSTNVSLLGEKGAVEITAKYNSSMDAMFYRNGQIDNIKTASLQSAYAVTNHLGLMLSAAYGKKKSLHNSHFFDEFEGERMTTLLRKYQYLDAELGAGWFSKMGYGENGRVNLFGGMGFGKSMATGNLTRFCEADQESRGLVGEHKGDYLKFFVQPSVGFVHDNLEVGVACRTTYLRYDLQEITSPLCAYESDVKNDLFIEPSFSIKIGIKNAKLIAEYKNVLSVTNPSHQINNNVFSVGLQFQFNALK